MRRIYLVRKDPKEEISKDNWLVMNRNEFLEFITSEEGRKRSKEFGKLNACSGGDYMIIAECGRKMAENWRARKDREDYLRFVEKEQREAGGLLSFETGLSGEEDIGFEEIVAGDDEPLADTVLIRVMTDKLRVAAATLSGEEMLLINKMFLSDRQMTEKQFGNYLGVSKDTIHSRKIRTLKKLRLLMDTQQTEGRDG